MKKFSIIKLLDGSACNIYSVRLDDEEEALFYKFYNCFHEKYPDEVDMLIDKLHKIATRVGIVNEQFKYQGGESIYRLKNRKSEIKLYCIKWDNSLLIIGGGALKNWDGSWQQDPEISQIMDTLKKVEQYLIKNHFTSDIIEEAVKTNKVFEL